jgi:hypothetical protein
MIHMYKGNNVFVVVDILDGRRREILVPKYI